MKLSTETDRTVIDKATFAKFVDMVERVASQAGVFIPRAA